MNGSALEGGIAYAPSRPGRAKVMAPRESAASSATQTEGSPSGGPKPMAISSGRTMASSQGLKRMERSRAGRARFPTMTGCTNSTETCWASVAYGPWPKASNRPPRRKRSDISRHASARRWASLAKNESKTWFLARRRCSICAASWHFVAIFSFDHNALAVLRSANTRQRIANEHVDDSAATIACGHQHGAARLLANFADDASLGPAGPGVKRLQRRVSKFGSYDRQELPFIRDVQRIETQQLTGSAHGVVNGKAVFKQNDAQPTIPGEFIERGGYATTSWITHPANAWAGGRDQRLHERKH